jgi:hypothetical protein
MEVRYPHGAWLLLSGLACFLLLVLSTTGWFVSWWLDSANRALAGAGADERDWVEGTVTSAWLGLLSLMSVGLILNGLDEMRLTYPEVGRRTARRIGPVLLTPTWIAAFLVCVGVLSFACPIVLSLAAELQAQYSGAAFTVGWSALLGVGTFLMIVSGEALRPLVPRSEERVIFAAEMAALFGGLLLAGFRVTAFLLGYEPAAFPPWVSVPAGFSGTFSLLVLVRSAWHIASRWEPSPGAVGFGSG